ncbi:MAG: hypothetical protein Q9177_000844, partial [Variospora cf. flavescens]
DAETHTYICWNEVSINDITLWSRHSRQIRRNGRIHAERLCQYGFQIWQKVVLCERVQGHITFVLERTSDFCLQFHKFVGVGQEVVGCST